MTRALLAFGTAVLSACADGGRTTEPNAPESSHPIRGNSLVMLGPDLSFGIDDQVKFIVSLLGNSSSWDYMIYEIGVTEP